MSAETPYTPSGGTEPTVPGGLDLLDELAQEIESAVPTTTTTAPTISDCLTRRNLFREEFPFEFFSNSSIKTWLECPRKYFYEYVLGLEPLNYQNWDLDFGSIVHEANAILARELRTMADPLTHGQYPKEMIEAAKQKAAQYLLDQEWERSTKTKSYTSAVAFLEQTSRWIQGKIILEEEQTHIKKLSLRINPTTPIYMVGTIDLIYQTELGETVIADYKTKSRIMNFFYYNCVQDRQFLTYSWLVGPALAGNFEVVIFHCVTRPLLIPHQFPVPLHLVEEAANSTQRYIEDILICRTTDFSGTWKKFCLNCQGYLGCDYIDLCLKSEKQLCTKGFEGFQIKQNTKRLKEARQIRAKMEKDLAGFHPQTPEQNL